MDNDEGYTDSTTWQAWFDAAVVLWDNTSVIFIFSLIASLVILVITWLVVSEEKLPKPQSQKQEMSRSTSAHDIINDKPDNETCQENASDEDDTVEYLLDIANHIPGEVKRAQLRAIEKTVESEMTPEQKENEMEMQRKQLEAIANLMQEQQDKFGDTSIEDIKNQMSLYCG
ncbi:uncharacterized protein LOC143019937 [Oratosquilla oratoria]|uniref:uncharacterized protein LOC143019937 n=1 Tax=Oratosquilla oratoria TaxID=337810 RepID=UPI003F765AB3